MAVDNWLPKPIDGKETGKMEAPLKAVDIRDTLNAYGGNVSNKTTSFFKPEANINKWSKHKPIVSPKLFLPFDDVKWGEQDGSTPNAILGDNNNTAGLESVFNTTSTEDDWFNYTLPTGGTSQPLRKGDFRGYRADATSPFKGFNVDNTTPINGDSSKFEIYVRCFLNNELDATEGGMISLTDLGIFNSTWNTHRLAVVERVKKGNGYEYSLHTGDTLETGWGYGFINRKAWTIDDIGTHEFKAVIHTDNGYNYVLPFPTVNVSVLKYYGTDTFLNPFGRLAYATNDTTGSSVVLEVMFTYIRGNQTSEDKQFHVQIQWGSSSIQSTRLDDVYFTIPDELANQAGDFVFYFSKSYKNISAWQDMIELHKNNDLYLSFGGDASGTVQVV